MDNDNMIIENNKQYSIPNGWVYANLDKLCSNEKKSVEQGYVPYVEIGNINIATKQYIPSSKPAVKGAMLAKSGDILISRVRPTRGAISVILESEIAVSSAFTVLRPLMGILSKYIHYFLSWNSEILNFLGEKSTGTMYPTVKDDVILQFPIPLSPLAEQKRIVTKLDELLPNLSVLKQRLDKASLIINRFRQDILVRACSGELTENWRTNHPNANGANKLLNNILSKRKTILTSNSARNYRQPINLEESQFANIPEGWAAATVDQLTTFVTSGSRGWAKYYAKSGSMFIRAQNISTDKLILDEVAYVRPPRNSEGHRTLVQTGDLLITITGANTTRTALIEDKINEAYINQHIALVRFVDNLISQFVYIWMISPGHGRAKLLNDTYGAGKPGLNLDNIRNTTIALPSIEEQQEILRRVKALFELADAIEKKVVYAKARVDKLTQSILDKTFLGELVPTEAELARQEGRSYEPASVLLDRISLETEIIKRMEGKSMPKQKSKKKVQSRISLFEVLKNSSSPMTPEELFLEAGFGPSQIDNFYHELLSIRDRIVEVKPEGSESKLWPKKARVILRLKKEDEK
jgi:type I restriction enzyme, S subunit